MLVGLVFLDCGHIDVGDVVAVPAGRSLVRRRAGQGDAGA
jgi:hypothetical protein